MCQYVCERYTNLSEEEKEEICQYGHERYKDLLEDRKEKLVQYINFFELLSASGLPKYNFFWILTFKDCSLKYKKILKCWKFYEHKKIGCYESFFEFFIACPRLLHLLLLTWDAFESEVTQIYI